MNLVVPFLKWLIECPKIKNNKLFLNAVESENNAIQVVTEQINQNEDIEYVDGSIKHRVVFTIFDFKSIGFNQLVKTMIENNENVEDLLDVGEIADWVRQKDLEYDFPDFGDGFFCEKVYPVYLTPSTPSIDENLAKYSIPIVCEVIEECPKKSQSI